MMKILMVFMRASTQHHNGYKTSAGALQTAEGTPCLKHRCSICADPRRGRMHWAAP
ncbi:hypothetical protein THIX_60414 [Thiomonas sp. X19]|nr:hypothetical protein THIX_60414 [Thiomonas sp. X19]